MSAPLRSDSIRGEGASRNIGSGLGRALRSSATLTYGRFSLGPRWPSSTASEWTIAIGLPRSEPVMEIESVGKA
ncbi:MAG: hypothetical protein ISN28_09120 [Ectothiorhodospiraceae bacterium AqS1]|nr:hypothetical protein [Ectothiorhodospiraceae bacterium AqS1]